MILESFLSLDLRELCVCLILYIHQWPHVISYYIYIRLLLHLHVRGLSTSVQMGLIICQVPYTYLRIDGEVNLSFYIGISLLMARALMYIYYMLVLRRLGHFY